MPDDLGYPTTSKIGATIGTVVDTKIEPHVEFIPGERVEKKGCTGGTYFGGPRCRWTYPDQLLNGEQFYQLQSLVGENASADVVIDTPTQTMNLATYNPQIITYSATMHWPAEDVIMVSDSRWTLPDDGILFTNLGAFGQTRYFLSHIQIVFLHKSPGQWTESP